MNALASVSTVLIGLLAFSGSARPSDHDVEAQPFAKRLVRTYDEKDAELVALSNDGQRLLARSYRSVKCPSRKRCWQPVLAAYHAATGERLSELSGPADGWFVAAAFTGAAAITVIERETDGRTQRLTWDPSSQTIDRAQLSVPKEVAPKCLLEAGGVLGSIRSANPHSGLVVVTGSAVRFLGPVPQLDLSSIDCQWIRNNSILVRSGTPQTSLYWISTKQEKPALPCVQFRDQVFGHAVSPDGTLIAVLAGNLKPDPEGYVMAAGGSVSLAVVNRACEILRLFPVDFPPPLQKGRLFAPQKKYLTSALLASSFAKALTISADNSMVAFGYGVRSGDLYSDSIAYVRVHSLRDGRRLATFQGDVMRNGLWEGLRAMDSVPTNYAHLGALLFSRDSKYLYATSEKLRKWDVSGLH